MAGERIAAWATVALAAATAVGALATWRTVDAIHEGSVTQLRAYVSVGLVAAPRGGIPIPVGLIGPGKDTPRVILALTNLGVTPSSDGLVHFGFEPEPYNPKNNYSLPKDVSGDPDRPHEAPIDISRDQTRFFADTQGSPLTPQQIENLQKNAYRLVFGGRFEYKDVFKNTQEQPFCFAFSWDQLADPPNKGWIGCDISR